MKAVVKQGRGKGQVALLDLPCPEYQVTEVLIQVKTVGVCGTDLHIWVDDNYPIDPPVILGHEFSGIITQMGAEVSGFSLGDRVLCETFYSTCGVCDYCLEGKNNLCWEKRSIGSMEHGAMADFVVVPGKNLRHIPPGITFEEASLTEPLACCVQAVHENGGLKPGDVVVITGPGTIGLLTLQVVLALGCSVAVVGMEQDKSRLALALDLGASQIFYGEDQGIGQKLKDFAGGGGVQVAFECSGAEQAIGLTLNVLRKGGRLVQVGIPAKPVTVDFSPLIYHEITIKTSYAQKSIWWDKALELVREKKVRLKPLITHIYPLTQWEEAFLATQKGTGIKHLLSPEGG